MTNSTIERLKQGCGQEFIINLMGNYTRCGSLKSPFGLCPICQAKLSQHTEDVEEFKKKINSMPCLDKRHDYSYPCEEHSKIINADELKSSLDDKDDDEVGE